MSTQPPSSRALRIAGAALVIVFGIWAGVRVYSLRTPASPGHALRVPVGEASPPIASDAADDAAGGLAGGSVADRLAGTGLPPPVTIPDTLPEFSLNDRTGKATSSATWRGKSLILNFWATWCAPCRREIPLLESLDAEWSSKGIQIVGVAVDFPEKVAAFADELKIAYPLLVGEQESLDVAARFGVDSPVFPFTVFTDRRGDIVAVYVGELHKAQADLILSVVQDLNAHHLALPAARQTITDGLRALATAPSA